ncbi:hypothetical protein BP5796_03290 [Coleophoma crateriformis]|uniref:Transcription initiation factor TFIID subunit 2 n=1 Tax=Coleophoma crateriformis TaxID=565419 RepID=A0A3D8SMT3_9HELO|nr:hypothetical protein BP5796_03290 [Coleophoma crateriformis]
MPGLLLDEMENAPAAEPEKPKKTDYGFTVINQKLELEIDFATQSLAGKTEITIVPTTSILTDIHLDARQCCIPKNKVLVNGKVAAFDYVDYSEALDIPKQYAWTAHHSSLQMDRLRPMNDEVNPTKGLVVHIPKSIRIEEADPFSDSSTIVVAQRGLGAITSRPSIAPEGTNDPLPTPAIASQKASLGQASPYTELTITVPFTTKHFRDGLQFVGLSEGDARYPHVYTKHSLDPGMACCIFPCVDDSTMRCTWDISITCSKTLGDALKKPVSISGKHLHHKKLQLLNRIPKAAILEEIPISDEDKLLEMMVVCSGELTNEVMNLENSTKKTVSYSVGRVVSAQHIGFAIGPFEQVDLSEFREEEDAEKLGQGQAVPVSAFALPGRAEEVRNACAPLASAVDYYSLNFGKYDFVECRMCFVDDQIPDTVHTASVSLCSSRLLFGDDIIDPEMENIRKLVVAVASQWMGVAMIPETPLDRWITIGIAHFITGSFIRTLCGTNDHMYRMKLLMDRLVELDVERPSLRDLGTILKLGTFEHDFMALKAPLVLFILDRRMMKAMGAVGGLTRIINKMVTAANTGGDSIISTNSFAKLCYKTSKYKCESFFDQWVTGAGCPRFQVSQRFNKKRLCVELTITQKQEPIPHEGKLDKNNFLRELKEEVFGAYTGAFHAVFTGPMTIRIHEADGTPYEHIVEIREGVGKFEIPYNTKYKRLKRSRRQKERANAAAGMDVNADNQDDVLIYCLGDVLQSPEEVQEWQLADWDAENEADMEKESYEWIRMDADFEWLCELNFVSMKPYMYVSQLQQDRDVVAQQESILYLKKASPHPLVSTFLIRTVMDRRYFHGIRTMATECLKTHAAAACNWIGLTHLEKVYQELFCYADGMPKANDFQDKKSYWVLCAIPRAVAQIRDTEGKCPQRARRLILDQLRFNDNGNNSFSDNHYVANLLNALADCLIPTKKNSEELNFGDEDEDYDPEPKNFRQSAIEEIDRYRRMDEWINSYQNIYTTTALECKKKLMQAGVIPIDPVEFGQYLHDGTADNVRIKAFQALVDLGFIMNDAVTAYLLNVISTDSSPYVRNKLFEVFCRGLASIAFGEHKAAETPVQPAADEDTLIEDVDKTVEERKAQIARTTSIIGALAALKTELEGNMALKDALWKAVQSPVISLSEQMDFLDICHLLYGLDDEFVIKLKYPRYWKAEHLGKGLLKFSETDNLRLNISKYTQKKLDKLKAPPPPPPPPPSLPAPEPVPIYQPPPIFKPTAVVKPAPAPPPPVPQVLPPQSVPPRPNPPPPIVQPAAPERERLPMPLKLSFKSKTAASSIKVSSTGSMQPPKRPVPPTEPKPANIKVESVESTPKPPKPRRRIVRLPYRNFLKVQEILGKPPNPAPVPPTPKRQRSESFSQASPAHRPSPAPSLTSSIKAASPAYTSQNSNYTPGSIVVKPRKPLPDAGGRKPLPDAAPSRTPSEPPKKRSRKVKLRYSPGNPKFARF